jgi:endonuclease YncB( thermonuclease family)
MTPPTLQQAIQAIKAGDKVTGRQILADILQADMNNELAWLWMSSVADSDKERRKYLEQVLKLNPENKTAQKGLAALNQKLAAETPPGPAPAAETPANPTRSLGARLAARSKSKEMQTEPSKPVSSAAPTQAQAPIVPAPVGLKQPEQPSPAPSEPAAEPAPLDTAPVPVPEPATDGRISEIRAQFMEPPAVKQAPPGNRLAQLWQTSQGKLAIGGAAGGLLLLCAASLACALLFAPSLSQTPPTVAAALETPIFTATATSTPFIPAATPTFGPSPTPTLTPTPTSTSTPVVLPTATVTPTPSRTPTPDQKLQIARVVGVVSGDMIDVILGNETRRVKYILVDAPVLNDPQTGTEPFGQESLDFNRSLVEGQTVTLEKDVSETDAEGRLLRYVHVGGRMVNEELLRQGLARVEMVPPDLKYGARFQAVEQEAQAANLGIWSLE